MRLKRKNKHLKTIIAVNFRLKEKIFAFFIIVLILSFLYVRYLATPLIISNTKAQLGAYSTDALNSAIESSLFVDVSYDDLIKIYKTDKDEISNIEANTVKINQLSKLINNLVLKKFLEKSKNLISIPVGNFSGLAFLIGVGPKVKIDVNPFGEVLSTFISRFESAGINQTYHRLYFNVNIFVNAVLPFKTVSLEKNAEVLICDSLIVGKIPNVFLESGGVNQLLNLVPEKFSSWQNFFNHS